MVKINATFRFDDSVYLPFRDLVKAEGRSMTWYLQGFMRDKVQAESKQSKPIRAKIGKAVYVQKRKAKKAKVAKRVVGKKKK